MGKSTSQQTPKTPKGNRTEDKASLQTRAARATQVGTVGPQSAIWQAQATVKDLGTKLVAAGTTLSADETAVTQAEAAAAAARTKRDNDVVTYDAVYNAYVSSAEHYSATPADLQALGIVPLAGSTYTIESPLAVTPKYDAQKGVLTVLVKCAPGLRRCRIEIASDQAMTQNLKQFPGDGARQTMTGLAAGTWWVHAAHVRAAEVSGFAGPVAVIVK